MAREPQIKWMDASTFIGPGARVLTEYGYGRVEGHAADPDAIRHQVRLDNGDMVQVRRYVLSA